MIVIKRDGTVEPFCIGKIEAAITKAFEAVKEPINSDILEELKDELYLEGGVTVEELQDQIEQALFELGYFEVAKAFILYREEHKNLRFLKDRCNYIDRYATSGENAATSSETDGNANVALKNVANLESEVYKSINRQIQRYRIEKKLAMMYPEVSRMYSKDLEKHIIYAHDESSSPVPKYYCKAITLYPLLLDGTSKMDGLGTKPPHNLNSFCGQFINLMFLCSSQCKGAVGCAEFFNFFDYFCVKEWGEDYYLKDDTMVTANKTIKDVIEQSFQNVVYSINQPAGNRSYQSPFINFNYFDSYYWDSLFGDFVFPDGSKPKWESVSYLQKLFMKWFNKERSTTLLTYPVESMCLLTDGTTFKDKEYAEFTAEMWSEGHSFFVYTSDNPDAVASCCFSKDTKVLAKSSSGLHWDTFEHIKAIRTRDRENFTIFHNGSWCKGKIVSLPSRPMFKVTTSNHKEFIVSDNHVNPTLRGDVPTSQLTTDDYLLFNTKALSSFPEKDEHLTYEMGFTVGAFIGDGSFGGRQEDDTIYETNFSQNAVKAAKCVEMVNKCATQLGIDSRCRMSEVYNNVYPIRISSKELVAFIQRWTNWKEGTYSYNKELNMDCLFQSEAFRRGILDGWYNTDGGNSNRCYTSSEKLKDCMEVLITSLGLNSIIDCSDRTDEEVVIRGESYTRNYPLWCVKWYDSGNKRSMGDVYKWHNNSIYFKVVSIEPATYMDDIYCFEMKNFEEPYFTLPSGLITHNCRLRNNVTSNTFSSTTGLTGVSTGSCNVITLNINRIVQDFVRSKLPDSPEFSFKSVADDFKQYLIAILDRVYKYQVTYKTILYEWADKGMFSSVNAGFIDLSKLYSTTGVNGINEAAMFLGMKVDNNPEYKDFVITVLGTIKDFNTKHTSKKFMLNLEIVPAEGLGSKNYNWDKEDGYWVPEDRVLYNSYIYDAHDDTSVLDKFILQGGAIAKSCDGGQAVHCNLEEHLSKEQYLKLMHFAISQGTSYYTFNIPNTQCDDCKHITKKPVTECPVCGSKNVTQWTRVIGFLRPIKGFDKYRQIEAAKRTYHSNNVEIR